MLSHIFCPKTISNFQYGIDKILHISLNLLSIVSFWIIYLTVGLIDPIVAKIILKSPYFET